jgi:hypothetical protein
MSPCFLPTAQAGLYVWEGVTDVCAIQNQPGLMKGLQLVGESVVRCWPDEAKLGLTRNVCHGPDSSSSTLQDVAAART